MMDMHLFLLVLLVITAMMSVAFKDLLLAAISLAVSSVVLAVILFRFQAPWAAVFELSVCAGLITVLFISAISIIKKEEHFLSESRFRFYIMPIVIGVDGVLLWILGKQLIPFLSPVQIASDSYSLGTWIWAVRNLDVIGQICVIVAGVLMVKAFFSVKKKEVKK
jgi:NADH-quinone oxidoreductase subunit J